MSTGTQRDAVPWANDWTLNSSLYFLSNSCLSRSITLIPAPLATRTWIRADWHPLPDPELSGWSHTNHDEIQTQHHWRFPKHTRLTDEWYFYVLYQRSEWRTFPNPHWPYCAWVIQALDLTPDPSARSRRAVPEWTAELIHTNTCCVLRFTRFSSIQRRPGKTQIRRALN